MKKFMKALMCTAIITALLAGFQMTATAAVATSLDDRDLSISSHAASSQVASSQVASSHPAASSHIGVSESDIQPYIASGEAAEGGINNPNPGTGMESMAIPGVVALLAATTAAITLTGKKK